MQYYLHSLLGSGADKLRQYIDLFGIAERRVLVTETDVRLLTDDREFPIFTFTGKIDPADFNELGTVIPDATPSTLLNFVKRVAALKEFHDYPVARLVTAMQKEVETLTMFNKTFALDRSVALVMLAGILGITDEQAMHMVQRCPPQRELREILSGVADNNQKTIFDMNQEWYPEFSERVRLYQKSLETQAEAKHDNS